MRRKNRVSTTYSWEDADGNIKTLPEILNGTQSAEIWHMPVFFRHSPDFFIRDNPYTQKEQYAHYTFDYLADGGRSYMVGNDVSMKEYISGHTQSMSNWQKVAYQWAKQNPDKLLQVEVFGKNWKTRYEWSICAIPDGSVMFALPHHGLGGEKNWITRTGKTMLLINVD